MMPTDSPGGSYHVHTHPSGAEHWRHVIEIVAFIVAAAWAFYVFIYQERIKPAGTLPQAQWQVTLSHQPVHSGAEFVSVTLEVHNIGTVRFRPAGWVLNVYGFRYLPQTKQRVTKSLFGNLTTLNRSLAETVPDLLQSSYATFSSFGAARAPFVVAPGQDFKARHTFGVPSNKYDGIFLRYMWCYARDGNTRVYDPGLYRDAQGAFWFRFLAVNLSGRDIACGISSREEFPL